jgi:hypothetical protein
MIVPYLVIYGILGAEVAMRRIAEEAEVVARLDYERNESSITVVSWPRMSKKMHRLYGKPTRDGEQVHYWKVPGIACGFRKPRKTPVLLSGPGLKPDSEDSTRRTV